LTTAPDFAIVVTLTESGAEVRRTQTRKRVRIGLLGYGWIARAHAHALLTLDHIAPLPKRVELAAVAGRRSERAADFAAELGFGRSTTRWEDVVEAEDVDVVAVATPVEAHAEAASAALRAGKPVLCEKPLAPDAGEARDLADLAGHSGVTNAVGFNYRYVPAVALAKELVDSGRLGELRHYRGLYLQDFQALRTQTRRSHGGAGAVLDYAHLVDMLRFLAGEPEALSAHTSPADSASEDQFAAVLDLPGGATATLEASRCALGWKGRHRVELNGSEGSLWWDMEDPNRLHVFLLEDERERLGGFRDVVVTNPDHPFLDRWWPPGHVLGWEHALVHQWRDFLEAALEERPVPSRQASFDDGYRAAVLGDAIITSAREGRRVALDRFERQVRDLKEKAGSSKATVTGLTLR
jgi:predicted dehydrogenase